MIKPLSLKLSAWFRALSHAIYLYLFLLCKDINRQNLLPEAIWVWQPLLKPPDENQSEFNCIRVNKDPWPDDCHPLGHPWVKLRFWRGEGTASEAELEPHTSHSQPGFPQWAVGAGDGSSPSLTFLPWAPAEPSLLRDSSHLPTPTLFMGALGLLGGFLCLWLQTAQVQSLSLAHGTFKQPRHLVTRVYLSKSVRGQCLNNSICILVPILFHLHFWSQPGKERDSSWSRINLCFNSWGCEPLCLIPEGNFSAVKSWLSHLIQSSVLLPRERVSDSSEFSWMNG